MKKLAFLIPLLITCFYTLPLTATCFDSIKNNHDRKHSPCSSPVVIIKPMDTTICEGDTVILTASGGDTYHWSTGQTTSTIIVVPLTTTTYYVHAMSDTCAGDTSATVDVVPGPYSCYILPTTATVCPGSGGVNFSLSGIGPYICYWSPSTYLTCSSCNNTNANPTSSITYTVTIFDEVTGCEKTVTVPVTVSNSLTAAISGPNNICKGSYATLIASGGSTYIWNNGDTTNLITVNPSTSTTYKVKVASGSCADDSATFELTVDSCGPAGINTLVQNKSTIILFPNPNIGQFTIAVNQPELVSEPQTIEIYNILGSKIYSSEINHNQCENTINIGSQPSGLYFYRILNYSGSLTGEGKFII